MCAHARACVSYQGVIEQLNKKNSELVMQVMPRSRLGHSCYLGIADGVSIARVWTCRYSKVTGSARPASLSTSMSVPAQRTCRRRWPR